jgi:hypothetical protein
VVIEESTATGSNEFKDRQMYIFTYFEKFMMLGPVVDPPCPSITVPHGLLRPLARGRVSCLYSAIQCAAVIDQTQPRPASALSAEEPSDPVHQTR